MYGSVAWKKPYAEENSAGTKSCLENLAPPGPPSSLRLKALVEKPSSTPVPKDWTKIAERVPTDPWQNEYGYKFPGSKDPSKYELISKGPDGIEGNEDDLSSQD